MASNRADRPISAAQTGDSSTASAGTPGQEVQAGNKRKREAKSVAELVDAKIKLLGFICDFTSNNFLESVQVIEEPHEMLLRRIPHWSYTENFLAIFPMEFWEKMTKIVRNLNINNSPTKKNPLKATTPEELIRFYGKFLCFVLVKISGIWMFMKNTYGNDVTDMRIHFNMIQEFFGKVPKLGQLRFLQLFGAFEPTLEELPEICDQIARESQR